MLKILITAFKPFGEIEDNSSLRVVNKIGKHQDVEIHKEYLDVIYDEKIFISLFTKYNPDILILCGQAASRDKVTIEKIGINYVDPKLSDNLGRYYLDSKICGDGPDAYFSSIDVDLITSKLEDNYPVKMSLSAGGYVCNYSLYTCLHYANKNNLKTKIGFIHFPLYKDQTSKNYPSLDIDVMVDSLDNIIKIIIEESICKV